VFGYSNVPENEPENEKNDETSKAKFSTRRIGIEAVIMKKTV